MRERMVEPHEGKDWAETSALIILEFNCKMEVCNIRMLSIK